MNTLIVYATKHGAARKCASMLKEKLEGKVDLHDLKTGTSPELKPYDKVIIGGSIYAGRIQKEVTDFCIKNLKELQEKKLGLYICCMLEKSANIQINCSFPKELLDSAEVKDNLGGEMIFSDMKLGEKLITKMVSKMMPEAGMPLDMKKDLSMLSEEKVISFAQVMNS